MLKRYDREIQAQEDELLVPEEELMIEHQHANDVERVIDVQNSLDTFYDHFINVTFWSS